MRQATLRILIPAAILLSATSALALDIKQERVPGGVLEQTWVPGFGVPRTLQAAILSAVDPAYANPLRRSHGGSAHEHQPGQWRRFPRHKKKPPGSVKNREANAEKNPLARKRLELHLDGRAAVEGVVREGGNSVEREISGNVRRQNDGLADVDRVRRARCAATQAHRQCVGRCGPAPGKGFTSAVARSLFVAAGWRRAVPGSRCPIAAS